MKYIITAALLLTALCAKAEIEITLLTDCICEGGDAQQAFSVVAEGSAAPFQFYWTGPDGYSSSEKEPVDIQSPGEYRLRVLNDYGCVFNYYIELPACPQPHLEYTPTPTSPCVENGGITATFTEGAGDFHSFEWYEEGGMTTGVQSLELSGVGAGVFAFRVSSVYPNPFQDELTIKLTASYDGKATIRMVNLLGQTVHMEEQAFIRGYNPLTVSTAGAQWQNGIYHLIVTDEKQNQFTEKVILQR